MTTKQKAKEVYNKFWLKTPQPYTIEETMELKFHDWDKEWTNSFAKQAALICCDEIQEALDTILGHLTLEVLDLQESAKDIIYWQEVKQEIEKL